MNLNSRAWRSNPIPVKDGALFVCLGFRITVWALNDVAT
jgi:hypothetical protein